MIVSKSVSIPVNDLAEIQKRIENGKEETLSKFVQKAIKNELRGSHNVRWTQYSFKTSLLPL